MGRWSGKTNAAHIEYCISASRVEVGSTPEVLRACEIRKHGLPATTDNGVNIDHRRGASFDSAESTLHRPE